jgi:cytochrome P450
LGSVASLMAWLVASLMAWLVALLAPIVPNSTQRSLNGMDSMNIDLLDVASYTGSQPHEQFAWLRTNDPVHRHAEPNGPNGPNGPDGSGFWAVTRFDDVKAIGRDAETFSSHPTIMIADPDPQQTADAGDHVMMLMTDPPLHTRMRRLISRDFTPRAVAALVPRLHQLAAQIVDEVIERGTADLVRDLAGEMPSFVIAEMLGIPLADGRDLYYATEALHSSTEAVGREAQQAAYLRMFTYSQKVFADKRANPADDLASLLANGAIDERPIDELDFFLWFLLLIDAGGDTTRNLVGGGMHALFAHPDQLSLLRAHTEEVLPTAVDELLRWVSPVIHMRRTATRDTVLHGQTIAQGDTVIHMRRTATRDTVLHGQTIAQGDKVVMYYGAANRDPACVQQPDRLDLTRAVNPHVAFGGGGPHFCLGSHLARLEITALLREILIRLPNLEQVGEPKWMQSNFIFGPTTLPVSFTPDARSR